jgi:hypothetical protein
MGQGVCTRQLHFRSCCDAQSESAQGQSATPQHVRVGDSFRRKRASWPPLGASVPSSPWRRRRAPRLGENQSVADSRNRGRSSSAPAFGNAAQGHVGNATGTLGAGLFQRTKIGVSDFRRKLLCSKTRRRPRFRRGYRESHVNGRMPALSPATVLHMPATPNPSCPRS